MPTRPPQGGFFWWPNGPFGLQRWSPLAMVVFGCYRFSLEVNITEDLKPHAVNPLFAVYWRDIIMEGKKHKKNVFLFYIPQLS
jgi:hypothetical protein